jgi:hypothetical protein
VPGATGLGYAVVGLLSAGFLLLAARTAVALRGGTYLPRVQVPPQAAPAAAPTAVPAPTAAASAQPTSPTSGTARGPLP